MKIISDGNAIKVNFKFEGHELVFFGLYGPSDADNPLFFRLFLMNVLYVMRVIKFLEILTFPSTLIGILLTVLRILRRGQGNVF